MKIVVRTLPRSPRALGGEDQIGFWLQEGFEKLGHRCVVCFDKIRQEADLVVSMGIGERAVGARSLLWYFNESFPAESAGSLGYDVVVSNCVDPSRYKVPYRKMPLAAHWSMLPSSGATPAKDDSVAYLGNFSRYKVSSVDKYLVPLGEMIGNRLAIYGGENWRDHPTLARYYRGILHPHSFPYLRQLARTWVAFRSEAQAAMGLMPDRVYDLVAAGVGAVVTDGPVEDELSGMVAVADDQESWLEAAAKVSDTGCAEAGPALVIDHANYDDRARRIIELCAGTS